MTDIAFIGGGNMATSIIGGLVAQPDINAGLIHVSDPDAEKCQQLQDTFGINSYSDNLDAIKDAEVVVLAVKPQVMKAVLAPLKPLLEKQQPLLISIAAGIDLSNLENWSGCKALVRCMPNTPALLSEGATGLYASDAVSIEQRNQADALMRAVGLTVWVKTEAEIDAVTAVSGSGPAYFFLLIEAMIDAGQTLGLSAETATQLAIKTAQGAGRMAAESEFTPAELRQRVTSPGGTTERAIQTFEAAHLREIVTAALTAAQARAMELSKELGD